MLISLRSRAVTALFWTFLDAIGAQSIRFIIGIILARLLFPAQFGLIGMLAIFFALAQSFLDSGFGAALIQKRNPTPTDICSIFYFNIVVGFIIAALLCVAAPWISAFYHEPLLTPLTRAMSLIIVINSFALIQGTILSKNMNFKPQTKASLMSGVTSGIIGITLALRGFGVWSLAIQQISATFLRTLLLWRFHPWRPAPLFSLTSLRGMFGFGSRVLASGLLNQLFLNAYSLVIGKIYSASDLGFFTRAKTLSDLPSQTLSKIVESVTFPAFSLIQDDPARLKKSIKKALSTLVMVNFPIMIGLAILARPLVLFLLTDKWIHSIPYIQLLSVTGLLYPLHVINLNLLQAMGRSDLFLRLEVIKKVLVVITIALTCRWGVSAIIVGMIATSLFAYYLNSYYTGILIGYRLREQLADLFVYLVFAAVMGIVVYAGGLLPHTTIWPVLLFQITSGTILYVGLCRIFRLSAFMDFWYAALEMTPFIKRATADQIVESVRIS